MLYKSRKPVDALLVPRLDFSFLHGGAAPRLAPQQTQPAGAGQVQAVKVVHAAVAQVLAPAEESSEAPLSVQPPSIEAAIACLGPLAMQPPKQAAMRREFVFV